MMQCYIIGYPLNKPRSVKLWRSFFKKKKIPFQMSQLEVKPEKFNSEIKKILISENFLASAITMPYKKKIKKYAIINDKISKYSNSVNFIIKKDKKIFGYNTDVYGALNSINKIEKKNIIIYGFGGSGEAIFRTIYKMFPKSKFDVITKKKNIRGFSTSRVKFTRKIETTFLSTSNLFINCSPLGSNLSKNFLKSSPITNEELKKLPRGSKIFDIVYSPKETILKKMCKKLKITYTNGLKMNFDQADKALKIVEDYYLKR